MNTFDFVLKVIFWVCAVLIFYAYAGYPLVIWSLSRLFGRSLQPPSDSDEGLLKATLVLAAFNEEKVIEERLRNALAMDYPQDKLEIIVGSDGSADQTAKIVRGFADRGVRLLDFNQNRGKASVLNDAMAEVQTEIVLMSDANTQIDSAAVRKLVRWFCDPRVGAVVGRLVLIDPRDGRNADGLYWKYETFLKRCEGRLGSLLGANGAIYAIRKKLYEPIPPKTIIDDFVIPLLAKLRTDCAIVYECGAIAFEETPADVKSEFHRRARIGAGGFQAIGMLKRLLDPRRGWIAFTFLSHKILRWLGPFFLIGTFVSSLLLMPNRPFYQYAVGAQLLFYLTSFLMVFAPTRFRWLRPLRLTTMFSSMNYALLVGFWRWLSGGQKAAWRRTIRPGETEKIVQ